VSTRRTALVKPPVSRPALFITLLIGGMLAFADAPTAALADSATSSDWSGYVALKSGVKFRYVTGSWRQPSAVCTAGGPTYSATWVGLGGDSSNSNGLEQIGTEIDCTATGQPVSSAWYELVPAAATPIRITVKPGDLIAANVKVVGHQVTVRLTDRTRRKSFSKTMNDSAVDVTSADWIVEAPSECASNNVCQTLPLADFGSVRFANASARTTSGRTGSISSRAWGTTKITLSADGPRYVTYGTAGRATPTPLKAGGFSFDVNYSQITVTPTQPSFLSNRASGRRASSPVQPGGTRR
jgi:hypothetical protein